MFDSEYNEADFEDKLSKTTGTIQKAMRYGLALSYLANEETKKRKEL